MTAIRRAEGTGRRFDATSLMRFSRRRGIVLPLALLVGCGYLIVVPLIRLQQVALEDGASGYRRAADVDGLGSIIATTVALALGSVAIAMVLGVSLAWASTRLHPGMRWLASVPLLPIIMPAIASVTGWVFLFAPRTGYLNTALRRLPFFNGDTGPVDIYTVPWIVVVTGLGLTSFVYVFVRSGLANIGSEIEEAGRISGLGPIGVFVRITLPLLRPVLVYGGGVALLVGLGQFTGPLLLGTRDNVRVLTTVMYSYTSEPPVDYGIAAAIGSPLLLFGIIVVIAQRLALGNGQRFVTHGGKAFSSSARPSRFASVFIVGFGLVGIVLPLAAVVVVSLSRFYSRDIDVAAFTLDNFRQLFRDPMLYNSIRTSVIASLAGVLCALPLGYLITSVLHARRHPRLCAVLELVVNLPLGVPAVVFGAGFLFLYTREPLMLYGTRWVIVLVYITIMIPYSVRMLLGARLALGDQYSAAARVSGAGPITTAVRVILPLMRPAIAGAAALMFVMLTHEFAASLLVRSTRTQVMGTQLVTMWATGSYPAVAAMAVTMCAVTAVGVVVAMAFSRGTTSIERL